MDKEDPRTKIQPLEWTALHVDYAQAPWRCVFWSAALYLFQPVLVPAMCLYSRIRRRPTTFGVVKEVR